MAIFISNYRWTIFSNMITAMKGLFTLPYSLVASSKLMDFHCVEISSVNKIVFFIRVPLDIKGEFSTDVEIA